MRYSACVEGEVAQLLSGPEVLLEQVVTRLVAICQESLAAFDVHAAAQSRTAWPESLAGCLWNPVGVSADLDSVACFLSESKGGHGTHDALPQCLQESDILQLSLSPQGRPPLIQVVQALIAAKQVACAALALAEKLLAARLAQRVIQLTYLPQHVPG